MSVAPQAAQPPAQQPQSEARVEAVTERLTGPGALLARLLRVPPEPAPPMGSPGTLRVFRAAPSYVKYRMVGWLIGHMMTFFFFVMGPMVVALALAVADDVEPVAAGLALVMAGCAVAFWLFLVGMGYLTVRVDRDLRWYMVTDRSLRIREGVWFVREMTMTFANIQNVSVSQGPLQRMFGLADLVVQTAGGGGVPQQGAAAASMHMGRFRGIADAQGVRDFVLARMKAAGGAGLGDADQAALASPTVAPAVPAAPLGGDDAVLAALRDLAAEAARLRGAMGR